MWTSNALSSFNSETAAERRQSARSRFSRAGLRGQRQSQRRERRLCAPCDVGVRVRARCSNMSVTYRNTGARSLKPNTKQPHNHIARGRREINGTVSKLLRFVETAGQTACRKRCAPNSDQILSRARYSAPVLSRGRAPTQIISSTSGYLSSRSR